MAKLLKSYYNKTYVLYNEEPGYRSRFSDCSETGRPTARSSSPDRREFSPVHVVHSEAGIA
jgi:hypothetical protein